jgi:hypothetical protein
MTIKVQTRCLQRPRTDITYFNHTQEPPLRDAVPVHKFVSCTSTGPCGAHHLKTFTGVSKRAAISTPSSREENEGAGTSHVRRHATFHQRLAFRQPSPFIATCPRLASLRTAAQTHGNKGEITAPQPGAIDATQRSSEQQDPRGSSPRRIQERDGLGFRVTAWILSSCSMACL